nr:MAG TPA: Protein of unknown function (DUF739) [Caudoviricetes sp.]
MIRKYQKIVRRAEDMGVDTIGELGQRVGMGKNLIGARLGGRSAWRADEIVKICKELRIPREEVGNYFFSEIP